MRHLMKISVMALFAMFAFSNVADAQFGNLKGLANKVKKAAKETVNNITNDTKSTVSQQTETTVSEPRRLPLANLRTQLLLLVALVKVATIILQLRAVAQAAVQTRLILCLNTSLRMRNNAVGLLMATSITSLAIPSIVPLRCRTL